MSHTVTRTATRARLTSARPLRISRPSPLAPRPSARGVTLMEVLISIGVLSIGLLGVAAMIPLGGITIQETAKADRAGACGRAGLRDVKIRGMLDPWNWVDCNGPAWATSNNTIEHRPVCIDPLFLSRTSSDSKAHNFPYNTSWLRRLSLTPKPRTPSSSPAVMNYGLAEQIFRWAEDLTYEDPKGNERPRLQYFASNGTLLTPPSLTGAVIPASDGNYSWMFTLSPAPSERSSDFLTKRLYTLSVVVFHKRTLAAPLAGTVPPERQIKALRLSGGFGGGDFALVTSSSNGSEYLTVKRSDWMMLLGERTVRDSGGSATVRVCDWYRIVSATENPLYDSANSLWGRYVVLAGPDWDATSTSASNANEFDAVLVDNVIGVYTATVDLSRSPLWTRGF